MYASWRIFLNLTIGMYWPHEMNFFENIKNLLTLQKIESWLFFIAAISFLTQPTNIRFFGFPFSLIILTILIFTVISSSKSFLRSTYILVSLLFILLVVHDFLICGQKRALVFFEMLTLTCIYYNRVTKSELLYGFWNALAWVCFGLLLIGVFNFAWGNSIYAQALRDDYQNSSGYIYLGISYFPATRNTDAFYFSVGTLIMLWRTTIYKDTDKLNFFLFSILLSGSVLSMSRCAWLGLLVAIIFTYETRYVIKFIYGLLVVLLIAMLSKGHYLINLFQSGFLSLTSIKAENLGFSYSNLDRIKIYSSAIGDFLENPLGHGLSYLPSYAKFTHATSLNSESLYIDFLLIFGIFSLVLFYLYIKKIYQISFLRNDDFYRLLKSLSILIFVYSIFNGGVDFVFLWFLIALIFLTINTRLIFIKND